MYTPTIKMTFTKGNLKYIFAKKQKHTTFEGLLISGYKHKPFRRKRNQFKYTWKCFLNCELSSTINISRTDFLWTPLKYMFVANEGTQPCIG